MVMGLVHTEISRPGYFTFGLLPSPETWNVEPQVSVDYSETPDANNQVEAHAWVRAPGAYIKGYMLSVNVPAVPDRHDMEHSIIKALKEHNDFSENMMDYLSMVVEKPEPEPEMA